MMEKNPRVHDFSCAAVREKPASEWDVTNLSAVLSAVIGPSDVPCNGVDVTQTCSNLLLPLPVMQDIVKVRQSRKPSTIGPKRRYQAMSSHSVWRLCSV